MNWIKIEGYNYSINELGKIRNDIKGYIKKNTLNKEGYYIVCLHKNGKGKTFKIHRLLAKYFLPDYEEHLQVDHIDRNPFNNNLENLRMVTQMQNNCNRDSYINSSSKYKGLNFHKQSNKWRARIRINYKQIHLGLFNTELEAAKAYNNYIDENNLTYYSKNII